MLVEAALLAAVLNAPQNRVEAPPRLRSGLISADDYPAAAIRAGEQGSTRIRMSLNGEGRVTNCEVVKSSGSAVLDSTTCAIVTQRYVFEPARNAAGAGVPSLYTQTIRWVLPDWTPPPVATFAAGELRTFVHVGSEGFRCAFATLGTAFENVADLSCPEAIRVPVDELEREPSAMMTRIVFTPADEAEQPLPAIRGTLISTAGADLEIAPSGRVIACTETPPETPASGPLVIALPPPCSALNDELPAFDPVGGERARRGKVRIELYRMGQREI